MLLPCLETTPDPHNAFSYIPTQNLTSQSTGPPPSPPQSNVVAETAFVSAPPICFFSSVVFSCRSNFVWGGRWGGRPYVQKGKLVLRRSDRDGPRVRPGSCHKSDRPSLISTRSTCALGYVRNRVSGPLFSPIVQSRVIKALIVRRT